jgi:hypothetical protein
MYTTLWISVYNTEVKLKHFLQFISVDGTTGHILSENAAFHARL